MYAGPVVRMAGGIASILGYAGFVVRMAGGIASILSVCRPYGENGRWYSKHSECMQALW